MPKPMAVPSAPRPKMIPTARTVMPWMAAMFSIEYLLQKTGLRRLAYKKRLTKNSVMLMCQRQVNDRQHHEYEGLQRDHKQVKHAPQEAQGKLTDEADPA